jgi:WhiB family transcriptional regulator, redox-sensing transcriptional regulator
MSDSTEWMNRAKCRDYPAEVFFPRDGVGVLITRKICDDCPVESECLEYALDNHVDHGIWGGKSERERRRLRSSRRRLALLNRNQ